MPNKVSSPCCRSVKLTCLQFHDLLLLVLVNSDGGFPLKCLIVTGLKRLVSSCVREGVSQHVPSLIAAASEFTASSLGVSRVPSRYCGQISEGPVPESSVADVPVRSQSFLPGGAAVGSLFSTEPAIGPSLSRRKKFGSIPGKN